MQYRFWIIIVFIFLMLGSIGFYYHFILLSTNAHDIDGKNFLPMKKTSILYIFLPVILSFALFIYAQKKMSITLRKYNQEKQKYANEIKSLNNKLALLADNCEKTNLLKSKQDKEIVTLQSKYLSSTDHLVETLTKIMELRDPYTAAHQKRVATLCIAIGKKMEMGEKHLKYLNIAAFLHDIGKISIPTEILSKPRKLDATEYELVKTHPNYAHYLLEHIDFEYPIAEIIHQHHENEDGSGYPKGLKGNQIRIEAKIINIANVIDSITSHSPFRTKKSIDEALKEITSEANKNLFDKVLINIVVELFQKDNFTF